MELSYKKSYLSNYIRYSFSNVLGMVGISCYILADTIFIAKAMGANGLAALNLAIPFYSFQHGTGLMVGIGASIMYTIYMSRGDVISANRSFSIAVFLNIIFSALYVLIGLLFSENIILALGASGSVYTMGATYLKVLLIFSPVFMFNDLFTSFVRNDGYPRLSMIAMLIGSFMNTLLDYIFIFPMNMGILGAVLATGISPVISICISLWFIKSGRAKFRIISTKISIEFVKNILMGGASSLITELSNGIVMIVLNVLILKISGDIGVASYGVIANIALVVIAIFSGIECGVQPLVSRGYGRGDKDEIYKTLKYAIISVVFISVLVYSVLNIWSEPIASLFNNEGSKTLQKIAIEGMRIYFIGFIFAGINIILSIYHSSIRMPKYGQIISILRGFLLIIPLSFLLSSMFKMTGVWMTFPITEFLTTIVSVYFLKKSKRKVLENI